MQLQEKLNGFRANFEADLDRKANLDNEALRVQNTGMEDHALKAGQPAPELNINRANAKNGDSLLRGGNNIGTHGSVVPNMSMNVWLN